MPLIYFVLLVLLLCFSLSEAPAQSKQDASAPQTASSQLPRSSVPRSFEIRYMQFSPQNRGVDDGLYHVDVGIKPLNVPENYLPHALPLAFQLKFDNIRSISELHGKIRPEVARMYDNFVKTMQYNERALEREK